MTEENIEDVNANTNNKLNEDNTVWPEKRQKTLMRTLTINLTEKIQCDRRNVGRR